MKKLSETLEESGIAFTFPIEIRDASGKVTYYESIDGYWFRCEYNANGERTYFEDSKDFWYKYEYNAIGGVTYYEDTNGSRCRSAFGLFF